MKAVILILGMMITQTQQGWAFGSARSSSGTNTGTTPVSTVEFNAPNLDEGTGGLKVVLQSSKNFNETQMQHLEKSRTLLENIVNTEEFKQRVLHFTYQGQETYVQNQGLTNLQIYNLIMRGAEQLPSKTVLNRTMDLFVQLYTSSWFGRNVVGYTTASTSTIYMNTYFYNSASPADTAANMIHEWLHKLGFEHDYNSTARRPYSVPYAIGNIVNQMGN